MAIIIGKMRLSWEDLKSTLYSTLKEVENGETVTVTRNGQPVAKLVPIVRRTRMPFRIHSPANAEEDTVTVGEQGRDE